MRIKVSNKHSYSYGTTFYRCTFDQIVDAYKDDNVWIRYSIDKKEPNWGIKLDTLFGSAIIDNVLYLCDTDGISLPINNEQIDPEEALDTVSIEDLEAKGFVQDADANIIKTFINDYSVQLYDIDGLARKLMLDYDCTWTQMYEDFQEIESSGII